jgi:hypothetical protein
MKGTVLVEQDRRPEQSRQPICTKSIVAKSRESVPKGWEDIGYTDWGLDEAWVGSTRKCPGSPAEKNALVRSSLHPRTRTLGIW